MKPTIPPDTVLFFDLDGTLVETDTANNLAYEQAIKAVMGVQFEIPGYTRITRTLLKTLGLSEAECEDIIALKERYYHGFLPNTKTNKAAVRILDAHCTTSQTALVTNCRQERALDTLAYHHLTEKFGSMFFGPVDHGNKYTYAITNLRIDPRRIVVFENEAEQIENARRAGITNIVKF